MLARIVGCFWVSMIKDVLSLYKLLLLLTVSNSIDQWLKLLGVWLGEVRRGSLGAKKGRDKLLYGQVELSFFLLWSDCACFVQSNGETGEGISEPIVELLLSEVVFSRRGRIDDRQKMLALFLSIVGRQQTNNTRKLWGSEPVVFISWVCCRAREWLFFEAWVTDSTG